MSERELAVAVIQHAIHDATEPHIPCRLRKEAKRFLRGGPMLALWCLVAGLKVKAVVERAHRVTAARV